MSLTHMHTHTGKHTHKQTKVRVQPHMPIGRTVLRFSEAPVINRNIWYILPGVRLKVIKGDCLGGGMRPTEYPSS